MNTITINGSYGTLTVHRTAGIVLGGISHDGGPEEPTVASEYADIRWFDPALLPADEEADILDTAFVCERGRYYGPLQPVWDAQRSFMYRESLLALPAPCRSSEPHVVR